MPRSGCSALHGVKNESQFFFLKKRSHLLLPEFNGVGERSTAKN